MEYEGVVGDTVGKVVDVGVCSKINSRVVLVNTLVLLRSYGEDDDAMGTSADWLVYRGEAGAGLAGDCGFLVGENNAVPPTWLKPRCNSFAYPVTPLSGRSAS